MSSIQERLQLKRVPLDTWNVREQLCLASAVVRSGDQNWMSVSRALKTVGEPNRPPDWYSQKSCAAQYGALLEHVETPKRKKRSSEGAVETPQESIVKKLTQDRIAEIEKTVADLTQQHEALKNEINEALNPATSEERLKEIWSNIEAAKKNKEKENARRAALLKEREERRARAVRSGRGSGNTPPSPGAGPAPPSSPLLTSLLKSSPVVTTPQHIPHPASVVDVISPSSTAPTLSMLLEKNSQQQDSKRAAIEHIKNQLVLIEQQLKANPTPPPAPIPPSVEIDDIEIKAEDIYAFRDIDLHIPQVPTTDKVIEKPLKQETEPSAEEIEIQNVTPVVTQVEIIIDKEEPMNIDVQEEIPIEVDTEVQQDPDPRDSSVDSPKTDEPAPAVEESNVAFPEVKFPTPEIKVIQNEEMDVKEEVQEVPKEEEEEEKEEEIRQEVEEVVMQEEGPPEQVVEEISVTEEPPPIPEPSEPEEVAITEVTEVVTDIPLPPDPPQVPEIPLPPEPEVPPPAEEPEAEAEASAETTPEVVPEVTTAPPVEKTEETLKKEEDAEDSMPLTQMLNRNTVQPSITETVTEPRAETTTETRADTDDDTPMELSREEEKDGKKKRDYSRKKKPDSRTCSGSESAEASAPESPTTASDIEREHRLWKKSVMLVYTRLCGHRYAPVFQRPITDEEAPGYSAVVRRPMDLTTIRRNIDTGNITTTAEFQRDVLLMISNALIYNSSSHAVYSMARSLHDEAAMQLGMLLAAQAHSGLNASHRKRRRNKRLR